MNKGLPTMWSSGKTTESRHSRMADFGFFSRLRRNGFHFIIVLYNDWLLVRIRNYSFSRFFDSRTTLPGEKKSRNARWAA